MQVYQVANITNPPDEPQTFVNDANNPIKIQVP